MADEKITIDVTAALSDIAKLKGGLSDVQAQAAKTGNAMAQAMNVGAAHGVADAINDLQKEYDDLKRSADTLKSALKGATDPTVINLYSRSIAELEHGMSRLEKTGKAAGVNLKEVNKEAGTGKQVFENLFGAFSKVALITAAISAVKDFVVNAVQLSQQIQSAKRSFEAFTGSAKEADKIVNTLIATGQKNFIPTDQILEAGKALLAFGENADNLPDVLGRIADVSAATGKNFNELTTIYGKARAAGVLYAEDINQLVDAGIPIIQEFAKQMGVSNDQVKKLASEGKISFEELQLAMFNLTAEGGKFADQSQVQADSVAGGWKRLVANVTPVISTIGDAFSSVIQEGLNKLNGFLEFAKKLGENVAIGATGAFFNIDTNKEQQQNAEKERDKLEKAAEEARNKAKRANAAKAAKEAEAIEKQRQQALINGMKDGVEKEIAIENLRYKTLIKELNRFHLDTTQATEQHEATLDEIRQKEADRQHDLLLRSLEIRKAINDKDIELAEKAVKDRADATSNRVEELTALKNLKDQEIDIAEQGAEGAILALKEQGKSEKEIKEAQRLLDIEFQKARLQNELDFQLALLDTVAQGDDKRLQEILNNIDLIRKKIGNLDVKSGKGKKNDKSLLELLGFDDKQIESLEKVKDKIIGVLQQIADQRVQDAEQELELAQQKREDAEKALDQEKQRAEDGFANNVALRQSELDQAKADEEKAFAIKKDAQKKQLLLDVALQSSALITSAANIIRGWSTIPFAGLVLGATAVAGLFSIFSTIKARSAQASKFKHGGSGRVDGNSIIVGESHDTGGVGIEAEGGEFFGTDGKRFGIVNKKMTAKHFDLISAINKDDKHGMIAAVSRIAMNRDAVGNALGAAGGSVAIVNTGADNETKAILKDWRRESGRKKSVVVADGYVIETVGNHTRRIATK